MLLLTPSEDWLGAEKIGLGRSFYSEIRWEGRHGDLHGGLLKVRRPSTRSSLSDRQSLAELLFSSCRLWLCQIRWGRGTDSWCSWSAASFAQSVVGHRSHLPQEDSSPVHLPRSYLLGSLCHREFRTDLKAFNCPETASSTPTFLLTRCTSTRSGINQSASPNLFRGGAECARLTCLNLSQRAFRRMTVALKEM